MLIKGGDKGESVLMTDARERGDHLGEADGKM